jgi:hypothetical protein
MLLINASVLGLSQLPHNLSSAGSCNKKTDSEKRKTLTVNSILIPIPSILLSEASKHVEPSNGNLVKRAAAS